MPILPRSGRRRDARHMKSWSSSSWLGALKECTSQPCGFTPYMTCSITLSLPAASMAWKISSTAHVLRVEPLLQFGQALDPLRQQVLGLVLFDIEVIGVAGIPVLEAEVVRIAHAIEFGKFREAHAMSLRSINGKRAQSGMRIIFLRGTVNSKPAGMLPAGDKPEQGAGASAHR